MLATYSMSKDNILIKTIETWNGYSTKRISEEAYKLTLDEDRNAIVSTQQIIQNMMGTRRTSDKITMFILPNDSEIVSWTESVKGETTNCSAKFVYITFTFEGEKLYRKAVKIEKTTPLDDSSSVKEWSYWVKGFSRLATYGYWGDPKEVSCIDTSLNISLENPITEISKTEYDDKQ